MTEVPTTTATVYRVAPTGYEGFVNSDKHMWCLYVVMGRDETEWSIRRGHPDSPFVLNRAGEWVSDYSKGRRRDRRFSLQRATSLAEQHVDTLQLNWHTAQEASDHVVARLSAQATTSQETNPA